MIRIFFEKVKTENIKGIFIFLMISFMGIGGVLYWQDDITIWGLLLLIFMSLLSGVSFVWGTRIAQKDGFVDGFRKGKNSS